jgi:hypothetical protein
VVAQRGLRSLKQAETNAIYTPNGLETPCEEKDHNPLRLPATTLIRDVYRTLIRTGRSYAAFTDKDIAFLEHLRGVGEILDPMAGYGLLTQHCAKIGQRSYCVEFNLPQYFWQVLCHPAHAQEFIKCLWQLQAWQPRWPKTTVRATVSDTWFPEESQRILLELLDLSKDSIDACFDPSKIQATDHEELAIALALPFVGRFACLVPGDISTHTKLGGMCVYHGWEDDFSAYLCALHRCLEMIAHNALSFDHTIIYADARTAALPKDRFGGMLTSPSYPNHRDFATMFRPERAFLDWLDEERGVPPRQASDHIIGSNFVAGRPERHVRTKAAKGFLEEVGNLKRTRQAEYDDNTYYLPFFSNYFADLEDAFANISTSLQSRFEGYLIVVNNTHRNILVPVSEASLEIWQGLGFDARIVESNESFHIGTKNPQARGLRARHTRYVIKIWR